MEQRIPLGQAALLLVAIVSISTGVFLYSGTVSLPACTAPDSIGACVQATGPITYLAENVSIPVHAATYGPETNVSFDGIIFELWPALLPPDLGYLQGAAREPGGIVQTFLVDTNNLWFGGAPPPTNASVRQWMSPDGLAGLHWLSGTNTTFSVELLVAGPPFQYAYENVSLRPGPGRSDGPVESTSFGGALFSLQAHGWGAFGAWTSASVILPNGTSFAFPNGPWDEGLAPPPLACEDWNGLPPWFLDNATCGEAVTPGYGAGLTYDGELNVTLFVRVG
jgi:hypothetical protein